MTPPQPAVQPRRNLHAALLASVSALTLLAAAMPAQAGNILVGNRLASPSTNAAAAAIASAQQAAAMTQQSMSSLTRATQAIQAMQQAQSATRALALGGANNLGLDPNHPGQRLPDVPNGLAAGGLAPDSGLAGDGVANAVTSWTNANTPTQTTSNGRTTVAVQQTAQKAILNWSSFNIGKNTELYIDQSAGNSSTGNGWIALNRVGDPSGVPSQILGSIKAEGSVYLLNANGIIFGGSSQVNVNSLIVSSLNLFSNDINASNNRFLAGGIGDLNHSNFATNTVLLTTDDAGAGPVTIASGASITLGNLGLGVIAAPNVTNSGSITAPSGQVALIAGIGVTYDYLNAIPTGNNSNATNILSFQNTGTLTDAANDITPVGSLVNDGLLVASQGNITLLGGTIQQNGVAVTTTSVSRPGTIFVTSGYDSAGYTGSVTFGPQAVTSVLPDVNGVTLPSDLTSLAPFQNPSSLPTQGPGSILINGGAIDFQGGSLTYAPGQTLMATVTVVADSRPTVPPDPGLGRILVENGAVLDVSGIPDVELPVTSNLLTVKLAGNELADDPEQRNGFLYGQTITVDMSLSGTNAETGESWVGTPLANLTSYANLVPNTIDQLLVTGGTITLQASEVVAEPGSVMNLTGGYIRYTGGLMQTTRLISAGGHIFDIGSASPDLAYVGIAGQFTVDHARWGVTETFGSPLISGSFYEPGYIQGANAGALSVTVTDNTSPGSGGVALADAGAFILDSTLLADAVAGTRQVATGTLPTNGSFSFSGLLPIEIGDPSVLSAASLAASVASAGFSMASPLLASPDSPYAVNVFNSQILDSANFGQISLASGVIGPAAGMVEDAGTSLSVQPGGSISLSGSNVTIEGRLTARAGSISISTGPGTVPIISGGVLGDVLIGSSAVLDVSGLFYSDVGNASAQSAAAPLVNGGSIALATEVRLENTSPTGLPTADTVDLTGNITLAPGSVLNLEGGGHVLANGALQRDSATGAPVGSGGNLTLATYQGVARPPLPATVPSGGRITVGGTIDALGFDGGGTLTLQAVALQLGGDAATAPAYAYYFDPTFWGDKGFDSFVLSAVTNAEVPAGTVLRLTHENLLPDLNRIVGASADTDPAAYSSIGFLTGTQLSPTSLSISAGLEEGSNNGVAFVIPAPDGDDATVGAGVQILADPGANISIASLAMVAVDGAIHAPGGSISLAVNFPALNAGQTALGPLYLGPQSVLNVSGVTLVNPLPTPVPTLGGLVTPQTGKVLAGGTVSLFGDWSPILVAPGAVINVSGASGAFDVPQLMSGDPLGGMGEVVSRQPVWSDAGTVKIQGETGLLFEGTLIGQPGAPQAQGGSLVITADNVLPNTGPSIWLVPDTAAALVAARSPFDFATYVPVATPSGGPTLGANLDRNILFGADSLDGSGFSNLALNGTAIGFTGQISLTLNGSFSNSGAANGQAGTVPSFVVNPTMAASLSITAPYILYGGGIGAATADATLTLNAQALDIVGNVGVTVSQATFNSAGDIRLLPQTDTVGLFGTYLSGIMTVGGNVTFAAADVYPATDTAYLIQGKNSTVTFTYPTGDGPSSATPLSAGGAVFVDAPRIVQDGEIQAPFGSIILGATDNSVLGNFFSVSTQSVTLGAGSITSVSANGNVVPYGATVDQTTWIYNPTLNNPSAFGGTAPQQLAIFSNQAGEPLTAAPQGVVTLNGSAVAVADNAVVNLDGGGNLQAQEWISGTGGSRNLLLQFQTSYENSINGQQVATYADGRQIFAILPGYGSTLTPFDATLSQSGMTAGEAVYLAGGNGLPAGVYTLLPAQYATLPGAYRVVVNSGVTNPLMSEITLPDGTMEMAGSLANAITGSRSSTDQQFYVQPASVWGGYSRYALTSADSFFPAYAATNNLATSFVPADAGRLVISATSSITLPTVPGTVHGTPAAGGFGAQLDISAQNLEIVGSGSDTVPSGTIALSASALDEFGAASLLIGGTRSLTTDGMVITPTANAVTVAGDAVLAAPELMLVATPQFQNQIVTLDGENDRATILVPVAGTGLVTIDTGAIVEATGELGAGEPGTIVMGSTLSAWPTLPSSASVSQISSIATTLVNYYKALEAAFGTLVRVSDGSSVTVQLPSLAQLDPSLTVTDDVTTTNPVFTPVLPALAGVTRLVVQSGGQLLGGNALTLASTGDAQIQAGALLSGTHIQANSSQITFVGSGTPPAAGAVIDPTTLVQIENAQAVDLQSTGTIAFQGDVDLRLTGSDGSLTLSAGALSSDGGTVSISAPTLVLDNELGAAVPSFVAGTGTLNIDAGALVFGTGAKTLTGFGTLNVTASQGVVGEGTGGMNFGSLPLTLQTPIVIADTGSDQTISTTSADINLVTLAGGTAMTANALGGAITFETQQSGSITVAISIQALAGNISLKTGTDSSTTTGGDVTVAGSGQLIAHGVAVPFFDVTEYPPGGAITLSANAGTVNLQSGSVVDFAGGPGGGNGGSLAITTSNSTALVRLDGTLLGATAPGGMGSSFGLKTDGSVVLDTLAQILTGAGVTGSVSVRSGQGDLTLDGSLAASQVALVANDGKVTINGAITANGTSTTVGAIDLYGTAGVDVEGSLTATGSPDNPNQGGLISIGTTGTGSTTVLNPTYGYEAVNSSGTITIGPNASIDASGGTVTLRAPLLTIYTTAPNGDVTFTSTGTVNVNVDCNGCINASNVYLDAYAVWSTADHSTNPNQHFDGFIDPAGWYDSSGNLVSRVFTDINGNVVLNYTAGTKTAAQLAPYLTNDYFTPNAGAYHAAHAVFYGGYDPNSETFDRPIRMQAACRTSSRTPASISAPPSRMSASSRRARKSTWSIQAPAKVEPTAAKSAS